MTTSQQPPLDATRSVVLIMDFQNGIVNNAASQPERVVQKAADVLRSARSAGISVIYVVHRGGRFEADSPEAEIHSAVAPTAGERILRKTRAGAFSTTGLDVLLRELAKDTLILMGVATSGCVLSTMRWSADVGYKLVVVSDACDDRDAEVHRVLTEKVFPRQGRVLTATELTQEIATR